MDYRRERAPKAAVTAAIGERGRRTGALMPRYGDVPLTQDGFEDPDAYFNSGSESASQDASSSSPQRQPQQSTSRGYASNIARVSPQRNAAATAPSQQQLLSSASRRQPRRDVTAELGVRGRRTGVTIVPAGQVARRSDGFEDMDAFLAIEPPSVPPVQRKKRISKINEDQEEEEEEEDAYDQTANYGGRGARDASTSRYANSDEMVGEEEDVQDYTNGDQDEGSEEEEDGDETRIADTTVTSTVQRRGNNSRASRYADEDDEEEEEEEDDEANDDGGTRSMSLEGSSYFNKSTRTALSQQAASSSKANRTTSTVQSRRSEITQRQSVRSPSRSASQSRSPSPSPPRQQQPPVASTSKQRRLSSLLADPTSSDEEERDAIQSSLTRSAQARQKRRSSAGNSNVRSGREKQRSVGGSASESPTRQQEDSRARADLKGKGKARPTLFAPASSADDVEREADQTAQTSARYDDDEDDDDDGQQGGFEPVMDVDDDAQGYDGYANGDETGGYGDPNDVAPGGDYDDDDQPGYESQDGDRQDQRRRRGESEDEDEADDEPPSRSRSLADLEAGHDDDDDNDEDQADEQVEQYDSDQVSDELPPPLGSKAKGRGRAAADDSGLGGDAEDDEQQEERPVTPPQKRGPGRPKGKGKGKAVVVGVARAGSQTAAVTRKKRVIEHPDGVRRSHRDRTSPVAYWRNEHVIYRRRDSPSGAAYYEKVGVADRPRPPVRSLVNQHKRSRSASAGAGLKNGNNNNGSPRKRMRSRSVGTDPGGPEDGVDGQGQAQDWTKWDEETDPDGIVWDYVDGQEIRRRVAFTSTMLDPKPTRHHAYKYQRVFTDGDYMAGGILIIPPTEKKPLKPARDNTYMFYCAQGAVRVLVHRTEFSVAQKGFFLIPRGNSYQINNLTDIDAVLIFMQAREVAAIADGEDGEEGAVQA